MQGWATPNTLSVKGQHPFSPKKPAPQHQPLEWKKKKKKQEEAKMERAAKPIKSIGPALETHQSHTIEFGVTKIVPQRYWQGNKSPAVLRGSASRRCIISVQMCGYTISVPAPAHTAQEEHHEECASGYTWSCTAYIILPQIDDVQGHTQTPQQLENCTCF